MCRRRVTFRLRPDLPIHLSLENKCAAPTGAALSFDRMSLKIRQRTPWDQEADLFHDLLSRFRILRLDHPSLQVAQLSGAAPPSGNLTCSFTHGHRPTSPTSPTIPEMRDRLNPSRAHIPRLSRPYGPVLLGISLATPRPLRRPSTSLRLRSGQGSGQAFDRLSTQVPGVTLRRQSPFPQCHSSPDPSASPRAWRAHGRS
jgi:hypothetical protein